MNRLKLATGIALATWSIALSALSSPASAQENRLGRLFYTPDERQKLDQKRGVAAPTASTPQTVIVNGMVVRTGQAPILFIDGKETAGTGGGASLQQQLNQGVPLKTESGQIIAAKPGQVVDLANGRAMEGYQLVPGVKESAFIDSASVPEAAAPAGIATGKKSAPHRSAKPQLR